MPDKKKLSLRERELQKQLRSKAEQELRVRIGQPRTEQRWIAVSTNKQSLKEAARRAVNPATGKVDMKRFIEIMQGYKEGAIVDVHKIQFRKGLPSSQVTGRKKRR